MCDELGLVDQAAVKKIFEAEKPGYVFLAAGEGIHANKTYPADFKYVNLQLQNKVIHNVYQSGVKKFCFLRSSCIHLKFPPQSIKQDCFLDGKLELTNEPYTIANIAGIKMRHSYNRQHGTNFISVVPTNLYEPNDDFDPEDSHVHAALIRKFMDAKLSSGNSESRTFAPQVDDATRRSHTPSAENLELRTTNSEVGKGTVR